MSKAKRIRALKEFIELEKKNKAPTQKYIKWAEEEIAKLEAYLSKEQQRISEYLLQISVNRKKRETAYENRILIKAGNRVSCRKRKIKLNKELKQKLNAI